MEISNFDLYQRVSTFLENDVKNWSLVKTIEELLSKAEGYEKENSLMAEKAAEKEQAFGEFMRIIEEQKENLRLYKIQETILNEQLKLKTDEIKTLKKSVRFEVFQENLNLVKENALLKECIKA